MPKVKLVKLRYDPLLGSYQVVALQNLLDPKVGMVLTEQQVAQLQADPNTEVQIERAF